MATAPRTSIDRGPRRAYPMGTTRYAARAAGSDLAIIDEVEVSFGMGLNIVTGETGAGKSILIDALGLVLGARASAGDIVRTGAAQAEVTALFTPGDDPVRRARFEEAGIDWDDELVVRRVVGSERSGRPLPRLAQRSARLPRAAHGPHRGPRRRHLPARPADPHRPRHAPRAPRRLGGQLEAPRAAVAAAYAALARGHRGLEGVLRDLRGRADREDLLRYQVKEIDEASLAPGCEEEWARERERLRHAVRLSEGSSEAEEVLYNRDGSVLDELSRVAESLRKLSDVDPALAGPRDLVDQALTLVQEASRELGKYSRGVHSDPERLNELEDRMQKLSRLKRKYGSTVEEVLAFRAKAQAELDNIVHGEARIAALEASVEAARAAAGEAARELSRRRREGAGRLGAAISQELASLGMGGARVVVDVAHTAPGSSDLAVDGARLLPTGIDRVEFLIAANRGEDPRPLRKIASGGELSRALLAVKRVLTDVGPRTFYVFDEVDTGVGGAIAEVIGQKIKQVAHRNQVLCITHLRADRGVRRQALRGAASARWASAPSSLVRELSEAERLEEVARMLGGIRVTDRTREAAAEMLRAAVSP
jgi:DNA repair protein RecN (Recombination protein N)